MTEKLGLVRKQESKTSVLRYAIGYILSKKKKAEDKERVEGDFQKSKYNADV